MPTARHACRCRSAYNSPAGVEPTRTAVRFLLRPCPFISRTRWHPYCCIVEAGGEYELEHPQFLLFPTYLHQNVNMLKAEAHAGLEPASAEPKQVRLFAAGVVTDILQLRSRRQMDALDAEHVWTAPLI